MSGNTRGTTQSAPLTGNCSTAMLNSSRTIPVTAGAQCTAWAEVLLTGSTNCDTEFWGGLQIFDLGQASATFTVDYP